MKHIVLKGYYGFGNLGDDILMLACVTWLKQLFPGANLIVATASRQGDYIIPLTRKMVDGIAPVSPEPDADLVVHGGGGVFYDFNRGSWSYYLLNRLIELIGIDIFNDGLKAYRKIKGWTFRQETKRIAIGVGLGTFTPGSRKYYHKITELASLDLILPRDQNSFRLLADHHRINGSIVQSSDLAFLNQYWMPSQPKSPPNPKKIGFVIKYWPKCEGYTSELTSTLQLLRRAGYLITLFLFEKNHDLPLLDEFKGFEIQVWCPETRSLADYIKLLAGSSLLVTSRAHGAIIGAAFGIPSICIGIEPKLKQVAEMFPETAQFLNLPLIPNELYDNIISGLAIPRDWVLKEFEENKKILINSLIEVEKYLQKYDELDKTGNTR